MEKRNGKLYLPNVTLCAMTSIYIKETLKAMEYSMRGIEFGDAVLITHEEPKKMPEGIRYSHIEKIDSIDRFNYETVYNMGDHIKTDFVLLVHYDGFVVNPDMWRDEFLQDDYIGSPWPLPPEGDTVLYRDMNGNLCRVGNSFSIRSKRLLDYPKEANSPWTDQEDASGNRWYNEDGFICCKCRQLFEEAGMKIAPLELAIYFGHENMIPEIEGKGIKPFVFHKWKGTNSVYPDFRKQHPIRKKLGAVKGYFYNRFKK